ncbi:hypothetical protein BGX38DRAFT_1251036 [Terfezia claveryi]|nr:hypothetical protein BGX38DRAFT_1251036 [Terfezia claveryi]
MTGITAACSFANELNITDFLILEARNEIGGRMQNTKIGSTTIEFGANWIQSLSTNPIWALAQKYHYACGLRLAGWTPLTPEEYSAEYFYHDSGMGETPVESGFIGTIHSHNETFIESGSDENNLCVDPRGFKQIIVGQAAEIDGFGGKLHLNEMVESMNGTIVYAKFWVLQHDNVKFVPPLSRMETRSLCSRTHVHYTKIFAIFPHKFWNSTQFTVYADLDERGYWPLWQSLDEEGFTPGSHVYFATLTSDQAYRAEKNKPTLRSRLNSYPIEFKFPRWTLDPLFRGSFSAWGSGVTQKQQDDMREAIGGSSNSDLEKRLFFAGEHTSRNWFGYLQGVYCEGRMAAHNLADCLLRNFMDTKWDVE